MNQLMLRLSEHFLKMPDKVMMKYSGDNRSLTYAEVDDLSGRIYRALRDAGIGKESHVLVNLPRGLDILVSIIGIWKAGASCIVCEDSMAAERIRFIASDSNAGFAITKDSSGMILAWWSL